MSLVKTPWPVSPMPQCRRSRSLLFPTDELYVGRTDEARMGFGCAGMSPLQRTHANPRRPPFTGCDRKDSEVSRFAIACSTGFTGGTRTRAAHPAILNVRVGILSPPSKPAVLSERGSPCAQLRLKSLGDPGSVLEPAPSSSHNRSPAPSIPMGETPTG